MPRPVSPRYKWQTRWTIDKSAGTATHETGLMVQMMGGQPRANNAAQVQQVLAVKHGHNAATMIARMLREAAALLEGRPYAS